MSITPPSSQLWYFQACSLASFLKSLKDNLVSPNSLPLTNT